MKDLKMKVLSNDEMKKFPGGRSLFDSIRALYAQWESGCHGCKYCCV